LGFQRSVLNGGNGSAPEQQLSARLPPIPDSLVTAPKRTDARPPRPPSTRPE
jgi:hypothetical protein